MMATAAVPAIPFLPCRAMRTRAQHPVTAASASRGNQHYAGPGPTHRQRQPVARQPEPNWPAFLASLFACGAVSGTLLDGIHSRVQLQVYEVLPLDLGGLHSSLTVPPLLGAFYMVLGSLFVILDEQASDASTTRALELSQDIRYVAAAFGALAASLQLSAWLYSTGYAYEQMSIALALVSLAAWRLFDGTQQGLGLAALCAAGAPLSELVLLRMVPLWSYPNADLHFGDWGSFVSWVPWCYFFYTPALGTLARYLWQVTRATPRGPPFT